MRMPSTLRTPRALLAASAAALLGLTAACSDAPSAPPAASLTPGAAPARNLTTTNTSTATKSSASTVIVGDTAVTTIILAPASSSVSYDLKFGHKISFPRQGSSVCDLASSYGPTEWDKPCTPTTVAVKITAKVWHDAQGLAHTDFQPALRFVPSDNVRLDMQNKNGLMSTGMRIDFCTATGCINEAATDQSVATYGDAKAAKLYRRVKHFSGYNVVVDRSGDSFDGGY